MVFSCCNLRTAALELRQSLSTTGDSIGIIYRLSQYLLRADYVIVIGQASFLFVKLVSASNNPNFQTLMEGNNEEAPFENPVGDGSQRRHCVRAGELTAEFIVTRPSHLSKLVERIAEHFAEFESISVQQHRRGKFRKRSAVAGAIADSGCADEADAFQQRKR